ncbi:MAG TPA: acyltransferase [Verrucomicrobiae bacterium]|jgi:acetyltransferase-like isoleucine patch superfamily enzyme|nr:acyltransferase [Verrucomicrobiae bacterium]
MILKLLVVLLPWKLRRWMLQRLFGYEIDGSARIGLAWVYPKRLRMGRETRIDHFTVAIHLDSIELGDHATIGRSNWITGHPGDSKRHFTHQKDRQSRLVIGEHSAITKRHYLDCTNEIKVGRFTIIAGHQSELLTHSIDVVAGRQDSKPIEIGDYCFLGTRCTVLGGARLPAQSVLAAGAVLTREFDASFSVYGGVPARPLKQIPNEAKYFHRTTGFVP